MTVRKTKHETLTSYIEHLPCFLDFYLVGVEKILKEKSPKKKTAEKNKKTKKKKIERTPRGAGRPFLALN